jgi:hypothetical protein
MGGNSWFPLPKTIRARLRYSELALSLNPGSGTLGAYVFSANGVYDPNITGTGHQPKGFDQLIALYDHCVVERAHIRVDFLSVDSNMLYGVNVSGTNTVTFTNGADYLELPHSSWGTNGRISGTGGLIPECSLSQSIDIGKFLGVDDLTDGREFSCDNSSNATEDVAFHVWAQSISGGDPASFNFVPVITYDVLFVEPRDPVSS